jgi:hypothetical protein
VLTAARVGTCFVITPGMGLIMTPSSVGTDRSVNSYVVALPEGATAFLTLVPDKGWALTIRRGGGGADDRGLFATTDDIMSKLKAEFSALQTWPDAPHSERPSRSGV